jgi:hypothetical protein
MMVVAADGSALRLMFRSVDDFLTHHRDFRTIMMPSRT